ncbi:MAG: TM2 domain-containing protein [Bacteroidota bacterium]
MSERSPADHSPEDAMAAPAPVAGPSAADDAAAEAAAVKAEASAKGPAKAAPVMTQYAATAAQRLWMGVQAAPRVATQRVATPYVHAEDHIGEALVRELHTYPLKRPLVMRLAWGMAGLFGAHRLYVGQIGWGLLMMVTLGGLGIWWARDGFHLRAMLDAYNDEQLRRQCADEPPIGMEFVPKASPAVLEALPPWAEGRQRSTVRKVFSLLADFLVLLVVCMGLGAVSAGMEATNSLLAAVAVVVTINLAPVLLRYHDYPIASDLLRWDYKLRLFYHFNRPGNAAVLLTRLVVAIFMAPFTKRGRTEVRLYLEIASLFAVVKALWMVFSGDLWRMVQRFDIGTVIGAVMESWVKGQVIGFLLIYMCTAVIGSILMKHTLLRRPAWVLWSLSAVALWMLYFGWTQG